MAGAGPGAPPSLSDISNSPAYGSLDVLVQSGELPEAQAAVFKAKYAKLHDVVLRCYDEEKRLLRKAKQLNQELIAEKQKLDKATARAADDSDLISSLQDELSKGQADLAVREEKEMTLQLEVDGLARHKAELLQEARDYERMQAELLQPQIDALERAVTDTTADVQKLRAVLAEVHRERGEVTARLGEARQGKTALEAERAQLTQTLARMKAEPDKARKQADVVGAASQALSTDIERLESTAAALDGKLAIQAKHARDLDEARGEHAAAADRLRGVAEGRERDLDGVARRLELSREEHATLLSDRVGAELAQRSVGGELQREQAALARKVKDYNAAVKALRRGEAVAASAAAVVPPSRAAVHEAERSLAARREAQATQRLQIDALRKEVDIFIANFLRQEDAEHDHAAYLKQVQAERHEAAAEARVLLDEDRALNKRVAAAAAAREAKARELARTVQLTKSVEKEGKVHAVVHRDLKRQAADTAAALEDLLRLHASVKGDRNRQARLIQEANQALAEMNEKMKVLDNEVTLGAPRTPSPPALPGGRRPEGPQRAARRVGLLIHQG